MSRKEKWAGVEETVEIVEARLNVFRLNIKLEYFRREFHKAEREYTDAVFNLSTMMVPILTVAVGKGKAARAAKA
jgi:hypothetical protein